MALSVRAGELRHRVSIQSRLMTRGTQGGSVYTWATLATVWASVSPMSANEFENGNALQSQITHKVVVRSFRTINATFRFLFGARALNVVSVRDLDNRGIMQEISCIEKEIGDVTQEGQIGTNLSVTLPTDWFITYQTDVINFLSTQSVTKTIPTNKKFYLDSVEIICTELVGTVVTQPTITAGITGSLTKYLNRTPTLITAQNKRQVYTGLGANEGESEVIFGITGAGAVSSGGSYRGYLLAKGVSVG